MALLGGTEGPLDICIYKLIRPVSMVVIYSVTFSCLGASWVLGLTKGGISGISHVCSMEGERGLIVYVRK